MKINYLVVHHSASPANRGDDAETIHGWHIEKGWDGIGYHYVILPSGDIQAGRPEFWEGSHAKSHNHESLGICLIGNHVFKVEQLSALRGLLDRLIKKFPFAKIVGHSDLNPGTQCPGFNVRVWWDKDTY
jgi:N-acetylmuramoyl-L-alanine amidase